MTETKETPSRAQKNGIVGMKHRWTPEEIQFLKDNIAGRNYTELAKLFNRKFHLSMKGGQLYDALHYHDPKNPLHSKNHRYTPEENEFIKNNIAGRSYAQLLELFNQSFEPPITMNQLQNYLQYNNLKNNGCNGSTIELHYKRSPIGSELIDKRSGYTVVKVAEPCMWRKKHVLIWEAANGPVPKGHVVMFSDGNKELSNNNMTILRR
jgi:hypothetical protein